MSRTCRHISETAQAKPCFLSPGAQQLGDALEAIATVATPEIWRWCAGAVPWPIGQLLVRAESADDLRLMARLARGGEYGDREDWVAAEQEWFHPLRRETGLKNALIARPVPFPLEAAHVSLSHQQGRNGLPWLEDFRALPDEEREQRSVLARLMLWALSLTGSGRQRKAQVKDVIEVVRVAGPKVYYLGIGFLDVALRRPNDFDELVAAIPADVRVVCRVGQYAAPATVFRRMLRHTKRKPTARALELLAIVAASLEAPPQDEVVLSSEDDDSKARAAAAFLAFISGADQDARLLGQIFGGASEPGLYTVLTSPIAQSRAEWATFLAGVLETAPRQWEIQGRIEGMVSEEMSRRTTTLVDRQTWAHLGLPEPHPLALTNGL